MGFATFSGEANLVLALGEARLLGVAQLVVATRAADAFLVALALLVFLGDRQAAGMALIVLAGAQLMVDGDALIEHEALALPQRLFLGHLFQVLQDTALEVIDLIEALLLEIGRGLLAADAAGAEHRHLAVLCRVQLARDVVREITEGSGVRVDGTGEGPHFHFIVIARVDQQHLRIGNQRIPVLRLHIGPDGVTRVDALDAHGDDLALELDLGAQEGSLLGQ